MKTSQCFHNCKIQKTKPQNTDFFFFFNPSAGKWREVMKEGPIKCDVRNQRETPSSEA